jgi:hypothetical protein
MGGGAPGMMTNKFVHSSSKLALNGGNGALPRNPSQSGINNDNMG